MDNKEEMNVSELPEGTYVSGNFIIRKFRVEYDERMMIPDEVRKIAKDEGSVPFIMLCDNAGLFSVIISIGASMYHMLDTFELDDEGKFTEDSATVLNIIGTHIMSACVITGDAMYYKRCSDAMDDFIKRRSENNMEDEAK